MNIFFYPIFFVSKFTNPRLINKQKINLPIAYHQWDYSESTKPCPT